MKRGNMKVAISERALIQRLNRTLAKDGEKLRKRRGDGYHDTGDFYIIDVEKNCVAYMDVDIEQLGRKLGVLAKWETLGGQDA